MSSRRLSAALARIEEEKECQSVVVCYRAFCCRAHHEVTRVTARRKCSAIDTMSRRKSFRSTSRLVCTPMQRRTAFDWLSRERNSGEKNEREIYFRKWRRGWDSNPRYRRPVHRISNPAHSTTLPPLRDVLRAERCGSFIALCVWCYGKRQNSGCRTRQRPDQWTGITGLSGARIMLIFLAN
jgi:hypothetical protein